MFTKIFETDIKVEFSPAGLSNYLKFDAASQIVSYEGSVGISQFASSLNLMITATFFESSGSRFSCFQLLGILEPANPLSLSEPGKQDPNSNSEKSALSEHDSEDSVSCNFGATSVGPASSSLEDCGQSQRPDAKKVADSSRPPSRADYSEPSLYFEKLLSFVSEQRLKTEKMVADAVISGAP